jgi:hypothetical protein
MFKIICELEKLIKPATSKHQITSQYLAFKNCKPCYFSDYQMFGEFKQSDDRNHTIEKVVKFFNGNAQKGRKLLSLNEDAVNQLYNKLYYVNDLTSYRSIMLFEENPLVKDPDNNVDTPWIYSAIIRHIEPTETEKLKIFWNNYFSTIYSFNTVYNKISDMPYQVIWENLHSFYLGDGAKVELGIINKKDYTDQSHVYYTIDKYFLRYLFKHQNNAKCLTENNLPLKSDNSEHIYNEYKQALPELVMEEYIYSKMISRVCLINNSRDYIIFLNGIEFNKNILESTYKNDNYYNSYIEICKSMKGSITTLQEMLVTKFEMCKNNILNYSYQEKPGELNIGNELYMFDCFKFAFSINFLGDLINKYED